MSVFLVSYDLKRPKQNYTRLYEELQKSQAWWHFLESTWLIETNEAVNTLYNRLARKIDANGFILVIEVKRNYQGWLPKEAWDWMGQRIN